MTDWNDPKLSQTWANRDSALSGKDESLAKMDYSGDNNIPDGAIRWNASQSRFEKLVSGSWQSLTGTYNINVSSANTAGSTNNLAGEPSSYYNDTPNGTRAIFYQGSAPAGWNQVTSINDRVLRVVSGSGGGTGGSWAISGLNVLGHSLSTSEMPPHTHGGQTTLNTSSLAGRVTLAEYGGNVASANGVFSRDASVTGTNPSFGSGDTVRSFTIDADHIHGLDINSTGGGNSHDHGISHNGNWRPAYANVIVCERSK